MEATASDGRSEILAEQRKRWQPVDCVPPSKRIAIDTGSPPEAAFEALLEELYKGVAAAPSR